MYYKYKNWKSILSSRKKKNKHTRQTTLIINNRLAASQPYHIYIVLYLTVIYNVWCTVWRLKLTKKNKVTKGGKLYRTRKKRLSKAIILHIIYLELGVKWTYNSIIYRTNTWYQYQVSKQHIMYATTTTLIHLRFPF